MSQSTEIPDDIAEESIPYAGTDMTLREVAGDLQEAHKELDEYQSGSFALYQNLKELRTKAEANGNLQLANTTNELMISAVDVFERTID